MKQSKQNIIYIVFFAIICIFIVVTITYYFRTPQTCREGLRSKKKKKKSSEPVPSEEKTDLTSNAADAATAASKNTKDTEEKIPTTFEPKFVHEMSPENMVKTIVKQLYDIKNLTNKINGISIKPK